MSYTPSSILPNCRLASRTCQQQSDPDHHARRTSPPACRRPPRRGPGCSGRSRRGARCRTSVPAERETTEARSVAPSSMRVRSSGDRPSPGRNAFTSDDAEDDRDRRHDDGVDERAQPDPAERPHVAEAGHTEREGREHERHDEHEQQAQEDLPRGLRHVVDEGRQTRIVAEQQPRGDPTEDPHREADEHPRVEAEPTGCTGRGQSASGYSTPCVDPTGRSTQSTRLDLGPERRHAARRRHGVFDTQAACGQDATFWLLALGLKNAEAAAN